MSLLYKTEIVYHKEVLGVWVTVTYMDGGYITSVRGQSVGFGPFFSKWYDDREEAFAVAESKYQELFEAYKRRAERREDRPAS